MSSFGVIFNFGVVFLVSSLNRGVVFSSALHCNALHGTARHGTALHGTARHCTIGVIFNFGVVVLVSSLILGLSGFYPFYPRGQCLSGRWLFVFGKFGLLVFVWLRFSAGGLYVGAGFAPVGGV